MVTVIHGISGCSCELLKDSFGNYDPGLEPPDLTGCLPHSPRGCVGGSGAPTVDTAGTPGQFYVNTDNGDVYVFFHNAYHLINGGGSGVQQVYQNLGDPNGTVTVTTSLPCICIDTLNDVTWFKVDGLLTNTGWLGA